MKQFDPEMIASERLGHVTLEEGTMKLYGKWWDKESVGTARWTDNKFERVILLAVTLRIEANRIKWARFLIFTEGFITDLHGRLGQRSRPDVREVLVDDAITVRHVTAVLRRTLARQQVLHLLLVPENYNCIVTYDNSRNTREQTSVCSVVCW